MKLHFENSLNFCSQIFQYAVRVFSRIVTSLFENNTVEISGDVDFTSKMSQLVTKIKPIKTNSSTNSILTEDWYQEANIKLITCTKGLIPICDNLHWKVRLELVKSAHLMLTKCSRYACELLHNSKIHIT